MKPEPIDLPGLLARHHLRPRKSLGQNYLWDPNILDRIVRSAELPGGAHVLEVGAGAGTLTRHLAATARSVTAIEIDRRLQPALDETLRGYDNVTLIFGDILELELAALSLPTGYFVVANIPYYITSSLIRRLLESEARPVRIVLTLQEEVARRICEPPGRLSLLALSVQLYGTPRIAARIPAGAFYPVPAVDSAVLRVDLFSEPRIPPRCINTFFSLARAGFLQKRKKIRNSLAYGMQISAEKAETLLVLAGIDPASRAQALDFDDWARLVQVWEGSLER